MKFLKILLIIIAALAAIFFLGGLFLPKTYTVSRSETINAPANVVYGNVGDFNNFLKWNPWTKMEPSAKVTLFGAPGQPGHGYEWQGKETGSGRMKIRSVEPEKNIAIDLTFKEPWESKADTQFDFSGGAGGSTKVVWSMSGTNSTTMEKWMSLMMDGMVGKDFEKGLKSLKELSEQNKAQ